MLFSLITRPHHYAKVAESLQESLDRAGLDYYDLVSFIFSPSDTTRINFVLSISCIGLKHFQIKMKILTRDIHPNLVSQEKDSTLRSKSQCSTRHGLLWRSYLIRERSKQLGSVILVSKSMFFIGF